MSLAKLVGLKLALPAVLWLAGTCQGCSSLLPSVRGWKLQLLLSYLICAPAAFYCSANPCVSGRVGTVGQPLAEVWVQQGHSACIPIKRRAKWDSAPLPFSCFGAAPGSAALVAMELFTYPGSSSWFGTHVEAALLYLGSYMLVTRDGCHNCSPFGHLPMSLPPSLSTAEQPCTQHYLTYLFRGGFFKS